jgi:hypothetical protein
MPFACLGTYVLEHSYQDSTSMAEALEVLHCGWDCLLVDQSYAGYRVQLRFLPDLFELVHVVMLFAGLVHWSCDFSQTVLQTSKL